MITPLFYIRGDFASEHIARVSDNGDRKRSSIKTEISPPATLNTLHRCLASRVPAMDCGWENLLIVIGVFVHGLHVKFHLSIIFGSRDSTRWYPTILKVITHLFFKLSQGVFSDYVISQIFRHSTNHISLGASSNPCLAGTLSRQRSGHSDFQIGLQFRTQRYFSNAMLAGGSHTFYS